MVARTFMKGHPRQGQKTFFAHWIEWKLKKHTIRGNYELWKKRIEQVEAGLAEIVLKEWVGKPYSKGSTQNILFRLGKEDGVGIEQIVFEDADPNKPLVENEWRNIWSIANNDGLSVEDFTAWFSAYDLSEPFAVIHFTPFRYRKSEPVTDGPGTHVDRSVIGDRKKVFGIEGETENQVEDEIS